MLERVLISVGQNRSNQAAWVEGGDEAGDTETGSLFQCCGCGSELDPDSATLWIPIRRLD